MNAAINTKNIVLSNTFTYDGVPVFTYRINYPQFQSDDPAYNLEPINLYYKDKAVLLAEYCQNTLYPQAVQQYQSNKSQDVPFFPYELVYNYQITLMTEHFLSLYSDLYLYTGGAHGSTVRFSNVWDMNEGSILLLEDFFPGNSNYKETIMEGITVYILDQDQKTDENQNIYFKNPQQNVPKSYNENNYYLTPEGIIVYFQQYDIAPYSSGIPTFLIPMSFS